MPKIKIWLLCVLLVPALLAACGDDDDSEADSDPGAASPAAVATMTTEPEESTPTEAADEPADDDATATVEATEEAEATPTEEAMETPTEEVEATPTESSGSADGTPEADSTATGESQGDLPPADPAVEAQLFETILAEEDLPEEWTLINVAAANDTPNDVAFCDAEPFSGIEDRLASVEAEFEQSAELGPYLLQSLTAYPEEQAVEAMEYAREITSNCTEWTDDEGLTYQLEPQDGYPQFGDESFVVRIIIEAPEVGSVPTEFVFARVGGLLMFMGYIQLGEIDPAEVEALANLAIQKMEAAEQ